MTVTKIENNTNAFISLFATDSFPVGLKLMPGLNTVPNLYLDELMARCVPSESATGKPAPDRYPGKTQLEELQKPVSYMTIEGPRFGPRITIYADDQAGRPDGPVPPVDLRGYTPEQALVAVKVTSDRTALKRWASDSRKEVKQAVLAKLGGAGD